MKNLKIIFLLLCIVFSFTTNAQDKTNNEKFGKTLNISAGIGYYGYIGHPIAVGNVNYEFDIIKNFTLAPFIGLYSYQQNYYWGNNNTPYRNYSYKTVVVPAGIKGTYYFDELIHASSKWDFYGSGSIGFTFRKSVWENEYYGDKRIIQTASPLYLNAHIGAEYHMTSKVGIFLDLSTGLSTFGLAIHF